MIRLELEPLSDTHIMTHVGRVVENASLSIAPEAARILTRACHGIPRAAIKLVEQACKVVLATGAKTIGAFQALRALRLQDLDEHGFNRVQRRIVEVLQLRGRPMGLVTLATHVGKSVKALLEIYEPDLVRADERAKAVYLAW